MNQIRACVTDVIGFLNKAFNQKPITQTIKNEDQKLNFSMDSQATEIQEVRLKTKLITKKGDTISYDLKSFENKNDRTTRRKMS